MTDDDDGAIIYLFAYLYYKNLSAEFLILLTHLFSNLSVGITVI